jgi:uncharacterized protein (TIGR02996 family)
MSEVAPTFVERGTYPSSNMPYHTLVARLGDVARRIHFVREILIGRTPIMARGAVMQLGSDTVTARHATISVNDAAAGSVGFTIEDLGSDTGTWVNNVRVPMRIRVEVRPGDRIGIGVWELEIDSEQPPTEAEQRQGDELLEAIKLNPRDDELRQVYGDWLEEQGRAEESELLAIEMLIRTLGPDDRRLTPLSDRLRHLASLVSPDWRMSVARPPIENCPIKFELTCPKKWDNLEPTADPTIRTCNACQENVYFAPTVKIARLLAKQGHCVSVDVAQSRHPNDLEEDDQPIYYVGRLPLNRR